MMREGSSWIHGHQPSADKPLLDLSNPPRGGSYAMDRPKWITSGPPMEIPESWRVPIKLILSRDGKIVDERELPTRGDVKIAIRDGKVEIETTVKDVVDGTY